MKKGKNKKKEEKSWFANFKEGNLKIWGFTISLNTVLTSLCCTIAGLGLAGLLRFASVLGDIYRDHPKMIKEINEIKAEQERVRREYHPPTNPTDPPITAPTPS